MHDWCADTLPRLRLRGWIQVRSFPIVVEDRQDLDRAVMGADSVRKHGGDPGRLPGLDKIDAFAELEPC